MQKLVWQNANGDEINLTGGNYGITEWEGFSNASLNIQNQQVPFQDGAVFLDALIEPRELSVTLKMQDNGNLEERYRMRRELIHILNPKLGEGYLIYTNDFISKRIKCIPQIPLFETHNSDTRGTPKASLAWTACEPYWEDLNETRVNLKKNAEVTLIKNEGEINSPIKIEIGTENVEDIDIINLDTQKRIKINGTLTTSAEINTKIGEKKVLAKSNLFKRLCGGSFYNMATNGEVTVYAGSFVIVEDLFGNTTSINKVLSDIVYAKGYFWGIKNGTISRSANGLVWIDVATITNLNAFHIYFEKDLFLICGKRGATGVIYYSTNGTSWTDSGLSTDNHYDASIAFNGNSFLAIFSGQNTKIYSSNNGKTWVLVSTIDTELTNIIFGNNYFYAISLNSVKRSSNGQIWEQVFTGTYLLYSMCYDKDKNTFVLCGSYIYTSKNGTVWNTETAQCPEDIAKVTSVNNQFYILTIRGIIIKSEEGNKWTSFIAEFQSDNTGAGSKDGVFFISDGYSIYKSIDNGEHYSLVEEIAGKHIIISEDRVIVYGNGNTFYESLDLVNWVTKIAEGLTDINAMFYGNGKYVAGSTKYEVGISINGVSWTVGDINGYFVSLAYANNIFVGIKNDGYIYSSSDGLDWTLRNNTENFKSVTVSDENLFVAVGSKVQTSTNGSAWQNVYTPSYTLNCVKFQDGIFMAIGEGSLIIKSIGGFLWEVKETEGLLSLLDIAIDNWICIAVGNSGAFLKTIKKDGENLISRLSSDSDMTLDLKVGDNHFKILTSEGNYSARLIYTQKYIGV